MKDTKVPQEIWNVLKRKTYQGITPNQTQFYITDEVFTELPMLTGIYTETQPAENWIEVTDSWNDASDWPELWDLLNGIYDGSVEMRDIKVCLDSDVSTITNTDNAWEHLKGAQKIAYYFVLDLTNQKFKVPRCLEDSRMIGDTDAAVFASTSNYAGCYTISAKGKYFEYGAFMRLVSATKTVDGESKTYYKPTQVPSPYEDISTETIDNGRTLTHDTLEATLSETLLNNRFKTNYFCANNVGTDSQTGLPHFEIFRQYPLPPVDEEKTTTQLSFNLPLYDESIDDDSILMTAIQSPNTEALVTYTIEGYVLPPALSAYNVGTRLYIKAV